MIFISVDLDIYRHNLTKSKTKLSLLSKFWNVIVFRINFVLSVGDSAYFVYIRHLITWWVIL